MLLIDKQYELKKKIIKDILIFCLFFVAFLAIVLLIFFLSTRPYYLWMIANILLTIAFGCYTFYFFSNPFKELQESFKLLKKVNHATITKEYLIFNEEKNREINKDLTIYVYSFKTLNDETRTYKSINQLNVEQNKKYEVTRKLNFIIEVKNYEKQ